MKVGYKNKLNRCIIGFRLKKRFFLPTCNFRISWISKYCDVEHAYESEPNKKKKEIIILEGEIRWTRMNKYHVLIGDLNNFIDVTLTYYDPCISQNNWTVELLSFVYLFCLPYFGVDAHNTDGFISFVGIRFDFQCLMLCMST